MVLNYLGASEKAIKLLFFPILMRAFRNWPNEFHSIASPCFCMTRCITRCHSLSLVVPLFVTRCTTRYHPLPLVVPLVVTRHSMYYSSVLLNDLYLIQFIERIKEETNLIIT